MPNAMIKILPEAKSVLEQAKSQRSGYTECLLASEAIIEKYGQPRHSMGPVNEPPKANGNPVETAAKIVRAVGSAGAALRHLEQYIEVDGEYRRNVRNVLIDMLESESKGGK